MSLSEARETLAARGASSSWLRSLDKLMHYLDPEGQPGTGHPRNYDHCQIEGLWAYLECRRLLGVDFGPTTNGTAGEVFDLVSHAPCTFSYAVKWGGTPWRMMLDPTETVNHVMRGLGVAIIPVHQFCEQKYGEAYPGPRSDS